MAAGDIGSGDLVQSFARGLAVIRAFSVGGPELTLSEVATRAEVTRAAARRFLLTLVDVGYAHTDGKRFWLRPTILELGNAYLSALGLADVARPHMRRLVEEVADSSALSVLSGEDMVYVALCRAADRPVMALNVSVGTRIPAYPTSMGRVLLAGQPADWRADYLRRGEFRSMTPYTVTDAGRFAGILDRVERDRFAIVDQELAVGLRSVAVPVYRPDGELCAALNVSTSTGRRSVEDLRNDVLGALFRAAEGIAADLTAMDGRRAGVTQLS
ncbi:MAG TPA: IclR family transcriptional regulator C-terminal domain-containing protein [Pseudonocardiaceae bacterium]|nr:IclR family transcriptional regulator C-terminal domain-containing protein [Pseudonocardiaceae bacterium]